MRKLLSDTVRKSRLTVIGFPSITLREKCQCPNTEFFLVRIFLYSDQKKPRIWTLFTQRNRLAAQNHTQNKRVIVKTWPGYTVNTYYN